MAESQATDGAAIQQRVAAALAKATPEERLEAQAMRQAIGEMAGTWLRTRSKAARESLSPSDIDDLAKHIAAGMLLASVED